MDHHLPKWLEKYRDRAIILLRKYSLPQWMVFIHDNTAVFVCYIIAYILRFNFDIDGFDGFIARQHAFITLCIFMIYSLVFRSYSEMLRHTTIIDVFYVFLTTTCSAITLFAISVVSNELRGPYFLTLPLSILVIHYVLITVYLFGIRLTIKTIYHLLTSTNRKKKKVLIFGAGAMGVIVKRVLLSDVQGQYHVAGFLDHNANLQGKKLNGIPVYSPEDITKEFLRKNNIETMVFAIKDISPSDKSSIIRNAVDMGLEVRTTPAVETWLNGELQIRQIEKVKLEDLLGREPIELNIKRIGLGLSGKTILVTGAAGSIGSEIVRQLILYPMKNLILLDQAETPMNNLANEILSGYHHCPVEAILADVTNQEKMTQIFKTFQPDIVFHAAAYKHVPLMEENPHEAIRVNVGGTKLITRLAIQFNVKKFVMISTDKAVNPTNIMGASKRLCEMIVQLKSKVPGNKTQFIITRFGNVLGSNGSVIPIFKKQIEEGGPLTVTHPEITRYFMTIPEACQLVLEAGFMGKSNEIYVFDMGSPVKIYNLACQMIRLSGLEPEEDIKIVFTGLRPGEKLYEEVLANEETTLETHHPKIRIAKVKHADNVELLDQVDLLTDKVYSFTKKEVADILGKLVPEYQSSNELYVANNRQNTVLNEPIAEENILNTSYSALWSFIGNKPQN